jgi:hypothetical protein
VKAELCRVRALKGNEMKNRKRNEVEEEEEM